MQRLQEKVMLECETDLVIVYGDTNSTLAAAITTKKLNFKLLHIEASCRTNNEKIQKKFNDEHILLTWHRQENTESRERMMAILDFLKQVDYLIVFPMHHFLWVQAQL